VREVYDQWTQFEDFPEFMEGVTAVHQESDSVLHWQADIGGQHREWRAKITRQEPDRVIAWESIDGARNTGVVTFEPAGPSATLVSLDLDFEPHGLVEQAGDKLGVVQRKAQRDLERFRDFIENRGTATGAWRGEIEGGQVTKPSN